MNNSEINENTKNEPLHILKTVIEQSYLQFDQYYKQVNGLPMGVPISGILGETY
jgi:hypothetical protein